MSANPLDPALEMCDAPHIADFRPHGATDTKHAVMAKYLLQSSGYGRHRHTGVGHPRAGSKEVTPARHSLGRGLSQGIPQCLPQLDPLRAKPFTFMMFPAIGRTIVTCGTYLMRRHLHSNALAHRDLP
jgi:hypothetical protein